MKIQLDTVNKTIQIEETINLGELMEQIQLILPNGLWKEFKLEVKTINYWTEPITLPYIPYTPSPIYPLYNPINPNLPINPTWVTCETVGNYGHKYSLNDGTFNIEINK